MPLSAYEELCELFFKEDPHRAAIDRMIRELPVRMREAISDYIAAPAGIAVMPTIVFGRHTAYVDFYRPLVGHSGGQIWERCDPDHCLGLDLEGRYWFGIGIYMEHVLGAMTTMFPMIHFIFCVKAFDETSVELVIKNLDGSIPIKNANDPASYADAAELAIDRIMNHLKTPAAAFESRRPIGFRRSASWRREAV